MTALLKVTDLTKTFDSKPPFTAVNKISFDLQKGEILGFLGPNGSGKTTTIQMLLGLLSYTSGSIVYFGKEFKENRSEILKSVSFASTYTSLPWILTIEENLVVYGYLNGLNAKESRKRFCPLLERFGILSKRFQKVSSLSAGQITRLMLVKAFFIEPKIALLDEPTASLDPDISHEICQFLLEQRNKTGLSILFTSHKMDEATILCDRVIFLKKGNIIADGLPHTLAKEVSGYRLTLSLSDKMDTLVSLAEKNKFPHKANAQSIELTLDEADISPFLAEISQAGITYTKVQIEEPSLEDYFLSIARDK